MIYIPIYAHIQNTETETPRAFTGAVLGGGATRREGGGRDGETETARTFTFELR